MVLFFPQRLTEMLESFFCADRRALPFSHGVLQCSGPFFSPPLGFPFPPLLPKKDRSLFPLLMSCFSMAMNLRQLLFLFLSYFFADQSNTFRTVPVSSSGGGYG